MADFLPTYQGDANLGVGTGAGVIANPATDAPLQKALDNSFAVNIQGQNERLKMLGDTQKTIALLDQEFNTNMYKQKVADRDKMYKAFLDGSSNVSDYLPQDKEALTDARTKYNDAYKEWSKNINNADAAKQFKNKTDELSAIAARLATRYASKTQQEQLAGNTLLPDEKKAQLENLNKWMNAKDADGKPALPSIYQKHAKYDPEKFNSQALTKTSKIPSKDGLFDTPFTSFDYKGTRAKVEDMQKEMSETAVSNEFQHKYFDELPLPQQQNQIDTINDAIEQHNTNHPDDIVEKISAVPIGGKMSLLDNPADYAAKFLLAQNPDKRGEPIPNEFGLKVKSEKDRNAVEKEKVAVQWGRLGIEKKKADAQISKWNTATKGAPEVKNEALGFANNIYAQLKEISGGTNVLTPEKVRQLTSEQLRYLGAYNAKDKNGKEIKGLSNLNIGDKDVIQLDNGVIRVMKDAEFNPKTRKWGGKWDPSRTTTISNIATNRVNEENQNSGGKEVNNYLPIDALGQDKSGSGTVEEQDVDLSGEEDPTTLKQGQSYNLKGVGKVVWNGKNLVKQK